jgi:hypothetical protein
MAKRGLGLPLGPGGKIVQGELETNSDGTAKWTYINDLNPLSAGFGDRSTFTSTKDADGKWGWTPTTSTSVQNLSTATGISATQITDSLYKTPATQTVLNGQRVNLLGGLTAAKKVDPTLPNTGGTTTNPNTPVDQTSAAAGGPAESGKAAGGTKTGAGSFGDFVYPEGIRNSKQDVIKFTMLEYKPSGTGATQSAGQSDRKTKNGIPVDRTILGSVVLPIPNNISDTNSMDWGSNSMNALEAALAAAAFTGITGGIGKGVQSFGKSMEAFVGEDKSGKAIGAAFAGAAVGGNSAAILSRAEGAVINPNLELLFNGPQLRPFNFTFKLAAREKRESEQIINILNFFKRGSSAIKTESNLFLKAPHTFSIQYLHMGQGGKDHPFIGRIKECALQSVTTSYTPEGQYATFSDGVMVSYQLTMQFQELEPIFNNDYAGIDGIGY